MTLEDLISEIRLFFDDFEIDLPNLQRPTYVLIRDFFTRALIEFEVETDNIRKASHLIDGIGADYPEITGDINLVCAINKTFSSILDFGLFDLLSPGDNPKRTIAIIANVMEFMNMAEELMTTMEPEFEQYREFRLRFNEIARENESLKLAVGDSQNEKSQIIESRAYMKNQAAIIQKNAQQMEIEYDDCKKIAKKMCRDCEENREKLNDAKMEKEKLVNEIKQLEGEMVDMKSLESKEELGVKVQLEKTNLEQEYMLRTTLRMKYAAAHELVKQVAAQNDELCSLFDEAKSLEETFKSSVKEVAEFKESVVALKKAHDLAENEEIAVKLERSKLIRQKGIASSEYCAKIEGQNKKLRNLREAIDKVNEEKVVNEGILDDLLRSLNSITDMFTSFDNKLAKVIQKKKESWEIVKNIYP